MELNVNAYHIGFRLNLNDLSKKLALTPVRKESTYQLYQSGESYMYFKDFGGVVFINLDNDKERDILDMITNEDDGSIEFERYTISVDKDAPIHVDFTTIYIPAYELNFVQIVALNLAQSVALDHYQRLTDELLEGTSNLSRHLEKTGRIKLTRTRLAQFIGKTMNLKNRIAENLYIFETPPLAWSDEQLAALDEKMNIELDFKNRHRSIHNGLDIVKENLDFFKDMLQHKHSSLLEWIIIILILFEVVQVFI